MATASYLYHTLGVRGYDHLSTEYRDGCVHHHVRRKPFKRECRKCGARWNRLTLRGRFQRTILTLPAGRKRQYVVVHGHRQRCRKCGEARREPIPFVRGKRRYANVFAQYVIELCRIATIKDVALFLGVGWDLIKQIHKEYLAGRWKRRKFGRLRYLAADEFATHRGHVYMTVLMDLESGRIVAVEEGKDCRALSRCLRRVKRYCAGLRGIAVDMSDAYQSAIRQVFADRVAIVHDPYHVVALANKAIDETRRKMMRELPDPDRRVLKGCRYVLLRGLENLAETARGRLDRLIRLNQPLYEAYLLKEQLRVFWNMLSRAHASVFLDDWVRQAKSIGNSFFATLADTLEGHRDGLLAHFDHPISTGPLEGLNNKIKVLKRRAYGFRDMAYFKLRLYFLHERMEGGVRSPFAG